MSKKNARSWKLLIATTTVMVAGIVLILNVGASARLGSRAAGAGLQSPSASSTKKPTTSTSPSPASSGPVPSCVPMVTCKSPAASGSPSTHPSTSTSPSTSPTPGGGTTYKSSISIDYNNKKDSFTGRVDSKSVCEKGRHVVLFQVTPGKDTNEGHTVTVKKGKYVIPFPKPNGRYYTKVKASTPARNTKCKGATSKTISE